MSIVIILLFHFSIGCFRKKNKKTTSISTNSGTENSMESNIRPTRKAKPEQRQIFQTQGIETSTFSTHFNCILLSFISSFYFFIEPVKQFKLLPSSPSSSFLPSSASVILEHLPAYILPNNLEYHSLTTLAQQQQPPSSFSPDNSSSSSTSSSSSSLSEIPEDIMMEMLVDQGADASSSASTSTAPISRFGADTFLNTPDDVMMNEDLEPVPRDRCNTWPMRRPQLEPSLNSSRIIHDQIPEEEPDLFGSTEQCGRLGASTNGSTAMLHSPDGNGHATSFGSEYFRMSESPDDVASGNSKKATTRRNAWGNMSYAELITTAIMASPEKRLTLAQVYEWMVQNVPYFRDKGDSNSSAGWKPTFSSASLLNICTSSTYQLIG
uniref:Fork-head domain-containing protein n=1 Tax=Caenorhabditis tropicalis TaxID=1561998 RepID=A0A1I7UG51_9PELO